MTDNFETAALRNIERGDRHYARELRDAGRICRHLVRRAIAQGWTVSVNDSEEWTVKRSTDEDTVIGALFTTDVDTLLFRKAGGERIGVVILVYGNAGYEVISDYSDTDELRSFMEQEVDPFVLNIEVGAQN